jgi:hypothetical protein
MTKRRIPIAGAEHVIGATEEREPRRYRIRHCEGAKDAWCLIALRDDGTEIDSYGGYTTSYSLDLLLKHAGHLKPMPGDRVELVP